MAKDPQLIDQDCPVRPCVMAKGLGTCAECADYGCDKLQQRWVAYEELADRVEFNIPQEDRERFILPYENKARLEKLRKG